MIANPLVVARGRETAKAHSRGVYHRGMGQVERFDPSKWWDPQTGAPVLSYLETSAVDPYTPIQTFRAVTYDPVSVPDTGAGVMQWVNDNPMVAAGIAGVAVMMFMMR